MSDVADPDIIEFKSKGVTVSVEDIFDDLSVIFDPERAPVTLAQLNVISPDRVRVRRTGAFHATVTVELRPTVPHCHLMQIIALSVRAKLEEILAPLVFWKVVVKVVPESHLDWKGIEKQVNDKERVCAALEQAAIRDQVQRLINPYSSCV